MSWTKVPLNKTIHGLMNAQGYETVLGNHTTANATPLMYNNPAQIPFAFLLGMMFGWLYYRTGSLLPGIIGHVLNNSVAAITMICYGDSTLEEQMNSSMKMWLWAVVATITFVLAMGWLDKHLKKQ